MVNVQSVILRIPGMVPTSATLAKQIANLAMRVTNQLAISMASVRLATPPTIGMQNLVTAARPIVNLVTRVIALAIITTDSVQNVTIPAIGMMPTTTMTVTMMTVAMMAVMMMVMMVMLTTRIAIWILPLLQSPLAFTHIEIVRLAINQTRQPLKRPNLIHQLLCCKWF